MAVSSLVTCLGVIFAIREARARVPALHAQAEEANASILQMNLAESRQQRIEDRATLAESRAKAAQIEEQLAEMKKAQHFRDIAQDELTRDQALKIESLEATNIKQQRDLDAEREARKQDVSRLQARVTDLENENKELRAENAQLHAENTELKKPKPRKRKAVKEETNDQAKAA
jgi:hypothetical protein